MSKTEYPLEDIREFFIHRQHLHGEHKPLSKDDLNWSVWTEENYMKYNAYKDKLRSDHPYPITTEEYALLKDRKLELPPERVKYLNAFINGYWWGR